MSATSPFRISRSNTQLTLPKFNNIISSSSNNLQINLIEPTLYFRGNGEESVGCFLRGNLILNLSKPTKIRKIEMKFVGKLKTFWPEGKLYYGSTGNQNDLCEQQEIISHNWNFVSPPTTPLSETLSTNSSSNSCFFTKVLKTRTSSLSSSSSKFHLIPAGTHKYPFELYIPGNLPETIDVERGTVNYKLIAVAVRPGLSPNLSVSQNVTIIRTFLEERNSEGMVITNDWNNQLRYEISIPKRAYPINNSVDVDLKLNPKNKDVKIDEIKIQIEEESKYETKGQKSCESRTLSVYKINDLTDQKNKNVSTQEDKVVDDLENFYHNNFSFTIPKSMYFSYKSSSINISHNLKFIFTIKPLMKSEDGKKKKRKIDVKVDVPITILSFKCADDLPQYEDEGYNDDDSPSYESPPSYEQSTDDGRDYLRRQTIQQHSSFNDGIATQSRFPLERLLTV